MQSSVLVVFVVTVCVTFASAVPLLLEDQEGQQYYLSPVLSRQRREDKPQWYGQGGANSKQQSGVIGFQNPNGSGGQLGYGHANGYGHDVSVGGMVPVWSNKNRYGETTFNVGGSAQKHFGGPYGNGPINKQFQVGINHRF